MPEILSSNAITRVRVTFLLKVTFPGIVRILLRVLESTQASWNKPQGSLIICLDLLM